MYEWSKNIVRKIADANCLEKNELGIVEISLRLWEAYNDLLNENIGLVEDSKCKYELEHVIPRPRIKDERKE